MQALFQKGLKYYSKSCMFVLKPIDLSTSIPLEAIFHSCYSVMTPIPFRFVKKAGLFTVTS